MMDPISEARLGAVLPELATIIRTMAEMLAGEGIDIRVVQGLRTWAEQDALYAQGRMTPGNIVTNAQGGHSYHNFGLAVDVAPFNAGILDWDANHPVWKRVVAVGESLGLVSGSTWRSFPDWPHFQYTGKFPVSPDDSVRYTFVTGGMQAVWDAVSA